MVVRMPYAVQCIKQLTVFAGIHDNLAYKMSPIHNLQFVGEYLHRTCDIFYVFKGEPAFFR
jgi:hypothetical protein